MTSSCNEIGVYLLLNDSIQNQWDLAGPRGTSSVDTHQQSTLQWRHNGCDGVSNYQPHDSLLNRLFRRRSKKTSKLRVTGLCVGNSPVTGEFPAQMASNVENVSFRWRLHVIHCAFFKTCTQVIPNKSEWHSFKSNWHISVIEPNQIDLFCFGSTFTKQVNTATKCTGNG